MYGPWRDLRFLRALMGSQGLNNFWDTLGLLMDLKGPDTRDFKGRWGMWRRPEGPQGAQRDF